ncbi:flagellar biosynthetic protein FliO [Coralloluteibacterium stylophorae]|uniref:Flagellar biosynthetic protein FliO n=1 Tax=Coralloluteibacterium stylophorae TaxID=1776034 RepID=A0AAP2CFS1_9GAMM|nr:flagellar biosynthetic protein FliO [Coralloluteibacterium stylophorae]MBS7458770.1 flagellar biosynthetic protein FliO [Coralloluteibacterium stylophorae]
MASARIVSPLAAAALAAAPFACLAASTTNDSSLLGELVSILLPLSLIIAALVAFLLVARRRFRVSGRDTPLSVLQIVPVGPRERVVVLGTRSGGAIAVGVSAQRVSFITKLDAADLAVAPPSGDEQ